jgi:hypothetical protein
MGRTQLEFFALPHEQLQWLREFLADDNIWCVLWLPPPNHSIHEVAGTQFLAELELTAGDERGGPMLFFGRKDLVSAPQWTTDANGERELDFTRSRAILFEPSRVVADNVLLTGRMSIMRPSQYKEAGIDPKPIQRWMRQVVQSFVRLQPTGVRVLTVDAETSRTGDSGFVATPSAIEWQKSGHLLKQFLRGAGEYRVSVPRE